MEKKQPSLIQALFKRRQAKSAAQAKPYGWVDRDKLKKVGESFKQKRSEKEQK